MSFSASTASPVPKPNDASPLGRFHFTGQPQTNPEGVDQAYGELYDAAIAAVNQLARAVGRPEDLVAVHISGHANPDHAPHPGWADEFVQITITAKPAKEA